MIARTNYHVQLNFIGFYFQATHNTAVNYHPPVNAPLPIRDRTTSYAIVGSGKNYGLATILTLPSDWPQQF